jgi:glycosyltransferase involved in cell wall biosynthesis
VPPADAHVLADALVAYARRRELRFDHRTAARQRVIERFPISATAHSYLRVLQIGGGESTS